jgi:hypothetical protein
MWLLGFLLLTSSGAERSLLETRFKNPPLEYRMNQNIHNIPQKPESQDSLIADYLANGFGGFTANVSFSHYLQPKAMKEFASFCRKAHVAGMELWLYDEQGYPSGNAGDIVIKTDSSWEAMGLYYKEKDAREGHRLELELPPGKIEKVAAFPLAGSRIDLTAETDLRRFVDSHRLRWTPPAGTWKIIAVSKYPLYEFFQAAQKGGGKLGSRYPSLMLPQVTEAFLNVTHEKYAELLGENLGKFFTATFTDEPSLMAVPFYEKDWGVIPWMDYLSVEIKKRYGYRPEEKYIELFLDAGPAGKKIRYQYFHTVADLMAEHFFAKINQWCQAHSFRSGGHLLLEETMMAHVPLYGDAFKCFRNMSAPGIDVLACFPELTPVHSPRIVASVADLTGADRVMCEPCPLLDQRKFNGQEAPYDQVRGFLNIQLLGGITDFNNYLKLEHSGQKEKIRLNEYVGRTLTLLRGGHIKSKIAVVYPIESLWTEWQAKPSWVVCCDSVAGGGDRAVQIEQTFRNVSRFLYHHRREYSYIDAQAIIDAQVSKGRLQHGNLEWSMVILPAVDTLPLEAWRRLVTFSQQGGTVVMIGSRPENSEQEFPSAQVLELAKSLLAGHRTYFLDRLNHSALDKLIDQSIEKEIICKDESLPIRYTHRFIDGRDVFFIINDGPGSVATDLQINYPGRFRLWDPSTGAITRLANNRIDLVLAGYSGILVTEEKD